MNRNLREAAPKSGQTPQKEDSLHQGLYVYITNIIIIIYVVGRLGRLGRGVYARVSVFVGLTSKKYIKAQICRPSRPKRTTPNNFRMLWSVVAAPVIAPTAPKR